MGNAGATGSQAVPGSDNNQNLAIGSQSNSHLLSFTSNNIAEGTVNQALSTVQLQSHHAEMQGAIRRGSLVQLKMPTNSQGHGNTQTEANTLNQLAKIIESIIVKKDNLNEKDDKSSSLTSGFGKK